MSAGAVIAGTPSPSQRWHGVGGIELAGDSWGPTDGPAVILLHGGGQTRHSWKGTGTALGQIGYRVVAYDARGHGDSSWSADGNYGRDVMVADLVSVISEIGLTRPALVGASMGGATSLLAIGENHVESSALVLVDIAPRMDPTGVAKIGAFMDQRPDGYSSVEEVADAVAAYQPHRARPHSNAGLAKNLRLSDDGRYRWHWDPRFRQMSAEDDDRTPRLERCATSLDVPTLLIRGGLSDILSEEAAASFLELCPASEYVNVERAGHMIAGDDNGIFAAAVTAFLRRRHPITANN